MLTQKTVTELLDAFSSPTPTPGGGSAAALAGALGASLLAMVAGLPKSKTGSADSREALDEARTQLLIVRAKFTELVDRDAAAYDEVVAAYKLPKDTESQKLDRKAAIQLAMRHATEVPIDTMTACAEAVRAACTVAQHGNPSAKSDIAVGVQLLADASHGALLNVEINIDSLTDTAIVDTLGQQLRNAMKGISADLRQVYLSAGIVELMKKAAIRAGTVTPEGKHTAT